MAVAQEVEERIMTMTTFKVKQGHSAQFKDGVKKWKECYTEAVVKTTGASGQECRAKVLYMV